MALRGAYSGLFDRVPPHANRKAGTVERELSSSSGEKPGRAAGFQDERAGETEFT